MKKVFILQMLQEWSKSITKGLMHEQVNVRHSHLQADVLHRVNEDARGCLLQACGTTW